MSILTDLLTSIAEAPAKFAAVAAHDPLGAVLMVFGSLFVGAAMVVFGVLTLGAAVNLVTPSPGGAPRQPTR